MELIAPAAFLTTLYMHPFSPKAFMVPSANGDGVTPQAVLVGFYLIHYLNRALLSPLRTPSRSPSHPFVVIAAIFFNSINGFLLGAYLSSATADKFLRGAFLTPRFWVGAALWAAGFAGNIIHDEILLNIRRKAKAKGKSSNNKQGEHYAIPTGLLYKYISYPNYFTEWMEWIGFSLAAAPLPDFTLLLNLDAYTKAIKYGKYKDSLAPLLQRFADSVAPPWAFVLAEITTMIPRAVRGHAWYHTRFGDVYPRERRIVIPFVF